MTCTKSSSVIPVIRSMVLFLNPSLNILFATKSKSGVSTRFSLLPMRGVKPEVIGLEVTCIIVLLLRR